MWSGLTGTHLIVIVFLVVLLFGAPKLPALAKSLGQSMKILKREVSGEETPTADPAARDDRAEGAS